MFIVFYGNVWLLMVLSCTTQFLCIHLIIIIGDLPQLAGYQPQAMFLQTELLHNGNIC
jgi:hypothetical protein